MASRMMRRVLVDSARSRKSRKRGGGAQQVTLDSAIERGLAANQDATVLDDALTALELVDERKCQVVELRFFGGLSVEETAAVLKVSPASALLREPSWLPETSIVRLISRGLCATTRSAPHRSG